MEVAELKMLPVALGVTKWTGSGMSASEGQLKSIMGRFGEKTREARLMSFENEYR